jgi:hypothetical protein
MLQQAPSRTSNSRSGFLWIVLLIAAFIACYAGVQVHQSTAPVVSHSQKIQQQAPTTGHSIYGKPSLAASQIDAILSAYHSPAAGQGQTLYALSEQFGIDDAYPLAFFFHESNFGTQGEARTTRSLGNLRCIDGAQCIDQDRGGYAAFANWHDGFQAWFVLITSGLYKGDGLTTLETIIPRYAPSADNNNEQGYISGVLYCVTNWQAGKVVL